MKPRHTLPHPQATPSMNVWPFRHRKPFPKLSSRIAIGTVSLLALQATPDLRAETYYWDSNDSTSGFGTAGGTWAEPTTNDATQGWSTSPDGTTELSGNTTTTTSDILNFGTASAQLGTGTINVSGNVSANTINIRSSSSSLTLSGGNIALQSGLASINTANTTAITNTISSDITLNATQNWTVSNGGATGTANLDVSGNVLGGANGLGKAGNGTLTLSGAANSWDGNTTVGDGTLNLSGNLSMTGTVNVTSTNTANTFKITGNFTQTRTANVRNFIIGGVANRYGTVDVSGSAIVNLTSMLIGEENGGNGVFNQSGGTVNFTSNLWMAGQTSALNVSGGSLNLGSANLALGMGTSAASVSTVTVSGTGSITAGTLQLGVFSRNPTAMTVNLGDGTTGGNLTINNMTYGAGVTAGPTTINFNGGKLTANQTFSMISQASTVVKSGGAFIDVVPSRTFTIGTALTDGGDGGGLTKGGTGTLILSGANTYSGATTLNQGTLTFGVGTLASTTGALSVNNTNTASAGTATILNLSTAANTTTGSLSGSISTPTSGTNTATINTQSSRTLTVNQTANGTYDGEIAGDGNFALGSLSTNILTLTKTNTYTGTTTVNAGTLSLGHATDTLSNSSAVTVDGNTAVLAIAGNSDTVGAVSLKNGGSITGTGGTLTGASYALESGSVSANLGGSGIALTKSTADTVTLSGKNTYSGLTTISAGKLLFSRTDTTSDYAGTGGYSISSGATLEVNASANARFNISGNQITGAGSFIKSGSGRTFFTAGTSTQTFNMSAGGYIDIQAGILDSSAQATNLAALNIATGAQLVIANTDAITTLQFDALTGGGTVRMAGLGSRTVVLGANGGSGTFSGVINDTGTISLTKTGAGTQILSGANTYTGQTTISAGTLQIGAGSTTGKLSTGSAIVNNSNLTINRSDAVTQGTDFSSAAITGTGSLTVAGTGTTTLNAANSYSGVTTVNAGADLRINGVQTGAGEVIVAATGKLGGSGSVIGGISVSGILAPGNSIESLGVGSLSFDSGSTYDYELDTLGLNGDLTCSSGTVNIATGTILTLTDLSASTALALGFKLTLISSVGEWNGGLFSYDAGAGLTTLADDSDIILGANIWRFNYNDTSAGSNFFSDTTGANNFVTMTVVPEPNAAMLVGSLGIIVLLRRRR